MASAAEVRFTSSATGPGFAFLSWDTEGTAQTKLNLLRPNAGGVFQVEANGKWVDGKPYVLGTDGSACRLGAGGKVELLWRARANGAGMAWSLENVGGGAIRAIRVTLPFNPLMAATAVVPSRWLPPDGFALPAVLSAADFGQLLIRSQGTKPVTGRFTGHRFKHLIDVAFEIPAPPAGEAVTLDFSPWQLPTPKGVDEATWKSVRRGWWNVYCPCVRGAVHGEVKDLALPPAGVLSNNPISDPVSSLYAFIADHALLVPELAPGVPAEYLLRHSLEWWLDFRTDPSGAVVAYYDIKYMLDAPPSIIVAAWACTELSGDLKWAETRIAQLEKIADYLASRDVDHDGIVESPKSGNANALSHPADRGATAWDTINSGHKDLYINALAYRAFCCLADIEKRLQRKDKAGRYAELAGRLRKAFYPTFYSPDTQLLSWWISADGKRHDYWAPGILGLPIAYGLVPKEPAEKMLSLIHAKVKEVGFTRLDLGLPCVLTPIRRADYHIGIGPEHGRPSREDGTDTFQRYLNGGCLVCDQVHWLNAHYRLGLRSSVQPQLDAMTARQAKPVFPNGGSFQNGIINEQPKGAEFYTWTGETCGYEGHLVYSWFFLQGVLTQHPDYLQRLLRPMTHP
ncbi:MAG TPA: hypothetical protein VNE39_03570 [Planctomycetota bacterium]|nr:hypothetical protein [Planctomycetota bacterium]